VSDHQTDERAEMERTLEAEPTEDELRAALDRRIHQLREESNR
jgi:hypothetical protein